VKKNRHFIIFLAFDAPIRGFPSEYRHPLWDGKTRMMHGHWVTAFTAVKTKIYSIRYVAAPSGDWCQTAFPFSLKMMTSNRSDKHILILYKLNTMYKYLRNNKGIVMSWLHGLNGENNNCDNTYGTTLYMRHVRELRHE